MLDIVNLYCKMVIQPIEEERNRIRRKYLSRNIFDFFCRRLYEEYLDKYNTMLQEKYIYLEKLVKEEHEFWAELKTKIEHQEKNRK